MKLIRLPLIILVVTFQGCVTTVNQTNSIAHEQFNAQQIAALDSWQLSGKLGLRSPQKASSANLQWNQYREEYKLRLSGPFGAGIAKVKGNAHSIEVQQGDKTYTGASEILGLQWIGVPIPVDAMSWWVRGLPSPNHEAATNMIARAENTPISFEQAGWQLSFSQFQRTDQYLLPKKVSGRLGDLSFKLVISDWRFPDN